MERTCGIELTVPSFREYDYDMVCGAAETTEIPDYYIVPNKKIGVLIKDIGNVGGCVAAAGASFMEEFYKRDTGEEMEFSMGWFYGKHRLDSMRGYGLSVSVFLDKWREIGAVPKMYVPNLVEMPDMKKIVDEAPELENIGKPFKLGGYVGINYAVAEKREKAICDALLKYGYGLFAVSDDYFSERHAIIIIGWDFRDKNNKKYIIQNSWGEDYGDKGIGTVPQKAINSTYLLLYEPVKLPFDDVSEDRYSFKHIKNLFLQGIMNGVSETKFDPEAPMTREQYATATDRNNQRIQENMESMLKIILKEIRLRCGLDK